MPVKRDGLNATFLTTPALPGRRAFERLHVIHQTRPAFGKLSCSSQSKKDSDLRTHTHLSTLKACFLVCPTQSES